MHSPQLDPVGDGGVNPVEVGGLITIYISLIKGPEGTALHYTTVEADAAGMVPLTIDVAKALCFPELHPGTTNVLGALYRDFAGVRLGTEQDVRAQLKIIFRKYGIPYEA